MKTVRRNTLTKAFMGFLVAILVFSFSACSRKIQFQASSVVPAANGYVQVKKDSNKNYVISLDISNLAEVDKMQPPKKTYVVWMETDRGLTRNIGQVVSSRNLNAKFETVSSYKPVRIFVTAEDNENTQYPGITVLTTNKFWN